MHAGGEGGSVGRQRTRHPKRACPAPRTAYPARTPHLAARTPTTQHAHPTWLPARQSSKTRMPRSTHRLSSTHTPPGCPHANYPARTPHLAARTPVIQNAHPTWLRIASYAWSTCASEGERMSLGAREGCRASGGGRAPPSCLPGRSWPARW